MSTKFKKGRPFSARAGSTSALSQTISTSRKYNYYMKNRDNRGLKTTNFMNKKKKKFPLNRRAESSYRIKQKPSFRSKLESSQIKTERLLNAHSARVLTEEGKLQNINTREIFFILTLIQTLFQNTLINQYRVNFTPSLTTVPLQAPFSIQKRSAIGKTHQQKTQTTAKITSCRRTGNSPSPIGIIDREY